MYKQNQVSSFPSECEVAPAVPEAQRDAHGVMRAAQERMEKHLAILDHMIDRLEGVLHPIMAPEQALGKIPPEKEYLTRTEREAALGEFCKRVSHSSSRIERLLERVHP